MPPLKLYYVPGFCSLAIHIVMRELGMDFTLVKVDMQTKQTAQGEDFLRINPKGQVPYLLADDGMGLSEGPVIAQYLADRLIDTPLLPKAGTMRRYRVMEWQAYVASEIHKAYTPLFHPTIAADDKALFAKILRTRYQWIDGVLAREMYLTGSSFTLADAYLFAVTRWAGYVGLDLAGLTHLQDFMGRVAARPQVIQALQAENQV
ncbi:MAG: glutathione transferase GstA [Polaromonas sp.]|uniref:glutathione transferase GstA n=1 Tax=Polaromonas sp. TaxID=1869339 RepID=UPI00248940D3|nr:glutathione transferase GstA [Polaromonas sp.]MDI1238047.1 glutathione transferase GstA [Polaromonas sp.]